jgi:nucleotide-binding universal stress UspA family protein
MAFKTILVPFTLGDSALSSLDAALCMAQKYAGHLNVLHIAPDPKAAPAGLGVMAPAYEEISGALSEEARKKTSASKAAFEAWKKKAKAPSAQWVLKTGTTEEIISHDGRVSDLIVIDKDIEETEPDYQEIITHALFETGKPVLLVPKKEYHSLGEVVAIAWDGSLRAARAVDAALPLLSKAARVVIITIRESDADNRGEALLPYLKSHSVNVEHHAIEKGKDAIGKQVAAEAVNVGADMLVMGAYTHSRMRQMILGGVTSYMFDHTSIPIFLAH